MDPDITAALRFLAGAGVVIVVAFLCWLGVHAVRAAQKRGRKKTLQSLGAIAMLFGWGHMRDPRNDTVAEANEGRVGRGTDAADPPDPR
jgi:hypothetical protein